MRGVEGRGLLSVGFQSRGVAELYLGLSRAAVLDRVEGGDRWRMRKPRREFESLDAACAWLCTPAGAQLELPL